MEHLSGFRTGVLTGPGVMKTRNPLRSLEKANLGGLFVAGLVLPGGSLLIAWAIYRWFTRSRESSGTTPSQ